VCVYHCAQQSYNIAQNSTDNFPLILQTIIIAQMASIRGEGGLIHSTSIAVQRLIYSVSPFNTLKHLSTFDILKLQECTLTNHKNNSLHSQQLSELCVTLSFFLPQATCPPHNCRCHVFPKMALAVIANWLDINILNNNCFTALCPGLPGWAGYQKKYSPTHCPDHHPVFISFFHLLLSTASSLFKLRAWQCFCTTSLHVLFGLPLGLETSTSYSIHFFTKSVSSFHNTCPYHRNLFCCSINIYIAYSYSFLLNSLLGTLSFTLTIHIHLTILISARWSATSFSFLTGQVSLLRNILLRTQLLYSLPILINDISLLERHNILTMW